MADYFVIGLNHKTAPVELREAFLKWIGSEENLYALFLQRFQWPEAVVLSTCNRVEIYGLGEERARQFLDAIKSDPQTAPFEDHLYQAAGEACIRHLFQVASSLDSMVVGEPQITGQVKDAYLRSKECGSVGSRLPKLFDKALAVAKRVRNETEVSQRPVSMGSVGVDLAKKIFGELKDKNVLVLGAGEMAEQVLNSLRECGVTRMSLANRSVERAEGLFKGEVASFHSLGELPALLETTDLLISSLGVEEPILNSDHIKKALKARKGRLLFLIDLGLPRNLDPAINQLTNVYLYNIDDLNKMIEINRNIRQDEAIKAYEIVEKEASGFYGFMLNKNPTIQMLGRKHDLIRRGELEKTLKQMAHLSDADRKAVERLSESLVNKILYDPVLHLRSDEGVETEVRSHDLVRRLFRLDET